MRLVMTLLVRDEEDVIEANLDAHLRLGVDHVIVTDNGSKDSTVELLQPYVRSGQVSLWHEHEHNFDQTAWVTRMARHAFELGADWVINNDADEFWFPVDAPDLREALTRCAPDVGRVEAARHNFPPCKGPEPFWERMTVRTVASVNPLGIPLLPKVCHRAVADVVVGQGNHNVDLVPGRLVSDVLEVLHFPLRTYQQFENKTRNGGLAYERNTVIPKTSGRAWRMLYARLQAGELPSYWAEPLLSAAARAEGLRAGSLVEDERLRVLLSASSVTDQTRGHHGR